MHDAPPPSWRNTGAGAPEPSKPRGWQGSEPTRGDAKPASKRNLKRTLAVVFLLAIVVAIGILILLPRQIKPSCLVLIGSGYEQNLFLPHNVYGWHGLQRIKELSEPEDFMRDRWARWTSQPTKLRRIGEVFELNEKTAWSDAWRDIANQIKRGDKEEKTVVLFFSMHGYADDSDAYLLRNIPSIQSAEDFEKSRIPFREVLASLKTLKDKNVVLLLDVCHFEAHWPIGVVHNDFVARVQQKYAAEISAAGNLTVICSTAPDQRSWASAELQSTWFAHEVAEALSGAARPDSGSVTAWTLFKHLEKKVNDEAQVNRARVQTPILLGQTPERLAKATSLVYLKDDYEPPAHKERPLAQTDLESLQANWSAWRQLKTVHAPHVYAPHLWRLYQGTLLRSEQLVRAGDPTGTANALNKRLNALQQEIIDAKALKAAFQSAGNSFPIRRVLGFQPKNDAAVSADMLLGYYDNDPAQAKAVLGRYSPPLETRFLLARLGQTVLRRKLAGGMFDQNAARARFVEIARDLQLTQFPVELQLLKMFQAADPALDAETVKLALQVRIAAEEAALCVPRADGDRSELYAETLFPRIRGRIDVADQYRRDGEDLIFGNPAETAAPARTNLTNAAKEYDAIRADTDRMRQALALRDEIAADLPFAAWWLANLETGIDPANIKEMRIDADTLGNNLALLNQSLAPGMSIPSAETLADIGKRIERIGAQYGALGADLETRGGLLQKQWHAIDAMLDAPPLNVADKIIDPLKLRIDLLKKIRDVSGHLHTQQGTGQKEGDSQAERRERQEKLLAACLKPYSDKLDQIKEGELGDKARAFYLKLPAEIRAADGATEKDTLELAAESCRVIPGALAEPLRNEKTDQRINPVDRLRRLETFHLLQWLAKRTLADHWFDGPDEPYYKPAAEAYLASARSLFGPDLPKALQPSDRAQRELLVRAGLTIGAAPNPYWTTEPSFPLEWKIDADAGVPEGTRVVWLDVRKPGPGAQASPVGPRKKVERRPYSAAFVLAKDPQTADGDIATVHAFFRGQHLTKPLVMRRPAPELIIHHPVAPDDVRFAARMDSGFDYGAISIVLDNSGSMKWVYPKKSPQDENRDAMPNERRRFDFALDALRHVLERTPNKTNLSIYSFGRGNDQKITLVRPPTPWFQSEMEELQASMKNLPGNLDSPIAETIVTAMQDGFPPGFKGPKIVIVLTDGEDNLSFGSSYTKNGEDAHINKVVAGIRKAQDEHPDVQVVVVCFIQPEKNGGGKGEYGRAQRQFKGVQDIDLQLPGKLFMQPDGAKLGRTIEEYLRPRVKLMIDGKAAEGFKDGRPVNFHSDKALDWDPPLVPANYRASIMRTYKNAFELKMPRGHDLFAVLKRSSSDGKLVLERGILGNQPEVLDVAGDNVKEANGWLATLMHNEIGVGDRKLSQLVAFERSKPEAPPIIEQARPGFVWIDLKAGAGGKLPKTLVWGKEWSLPAAAYRLEMLDWPKAQPQTTTWFWPAERESFLGSDKLKMHYRRDESVSDAWGAALSSRIAPPLESVVFEPQVEIANLDGRNQKRDCIVVRFQFPKGKPIFVDIQRERDDIGAVHQFFLDAGKGTAYFYGPVRPKTVNLVWFDIEEFKKAASSVNFAPRPDLYYKAPRIFMRGGYNR